jgi:hypothetical protein
MSVMMMLGLGLLSVKCSTCRRSHIRDGFAFGCYNAVYLRFVLSAKSD